MRFPIFTREDPKLIDLSREFAIRHLCDRGANRRKKCVADVAEMIRRSFLLDARQVKETMLAQILESLPNGNAGTRARAFIQERGIKDVEGLLRLTRQNILGQRGFGKETADALERACKKNHFRLGMLFEQPLNGGTTERM